MSVPRWTLNAQAVLALVLLIAFSFSSHPVLFAPLYSPSHASSSSSAALQSLEIALPAGTRIPLALATPISSRARPGDIVRAVTTVQVTGGSRVAIPAGTYVEGVITELEGPGPAVRIRSSRLLFANGYAVPFFGAVATIVATVPLRGHHGPPRKVLFDSGWQFRMLLQNPVTLNGARLPNPPMN
jgi:hypothetical protein